VGAQPSDRVKKLLSMADIIPAPPQHRYTVQQLPKAERKVDKKGAKGFATSAFGAQAPPVGMLGSGFFAPIAVPAATLLPWRGLQ
jgi:hypothetical protein